MGRKQEGDGGTIDRMNRHRSKSSSLRRVALSLNVACVWSVAGCGLGVPVLCDEADGDTTTIVVTFDDGPLRADVSDPADTPTEAELLGPMESILATLSEREIQAVFYVAGPGDSRDPDALQTIFGQGLIELHEAGHVLGYHAWRHGADVWLPGSTDPAAAVDGMSADLDTLQSYIDVALTGSPYPQDKVFSPLFRQPYGGAVLWIREGLVAADRRSWTYHGFDIDSYDWILHPDSLIPTAPSAADDLDIRTIVSEQLRASAERAGCPDVVDVLLHVNGTTAANLDFWLDELEMVLTESAGRAVQFGVPDSYLTEDTFGPDPLNALIDLLGMLEATKWP